MPDTTIIGNIVQELVQLRNACDIAITELRAIIPAQTQRTNGPGNITPEGRKRLAAAMKRRWAAKRSAATAAAKKKSAIRR